MKRISPLLSVLCASSLAFACASAPKPESSDPKKDKPEIKGPALVGRIASVPADKRFVLIQRYGKWDAQSGQILTTRGPDNRTANLKTTGEKLGEFTAADIQSGTVGLGDAVYLQHVPNPTVSPTPAEVAEPAPLPLENPAPTAGLENV